MADKNLSVVTSKRSCNFFIRLPIAVADNAVMTTEFVPYVDSSRDNKVSAATGYGIDRPEFEFRQGQILLFFKISRPTIRPFFPGHKAVAA